MAPIDFLKMEGCGNDYVFVPLEALSVERAAELRDMLPNIARSWSDRRRGIGADGVVLIDTRVDGVHARLIMANADGSRGEVCGNALRCVARWMLEERGASGELILASDRGEHRANRVDGSDETSVEVSMGAPQFTPDSLPIELGRCRASHAPADGPLEIKLQVGAYEWEGLALSMGNPHFVIPVEKDVSQLDVAQYGSEIEVHPAFPARVNVSFVQLSSAGRNDAAQLNQRTWERGSGETLACGSGACASAVAMTALSGLDRGRPIHVHMPGGRLGVRWTQDGELFLSGPTRIAFRGSATF